MLQAVTSILLLAMVAVTMTSAMNSYVPGSFNPASFTRGGPLGGYLPRPSSRSRVSRLTDAALTWAAYSTVGDIGEKYLPKKLGQSIPYKAVHSIGPLWMAHRAWNRDGRRRLRNHPYSAVQQVAGGFASGMEGLVGDANDAARFTQAFFREHNLNTQPTDYELTKQLRKEIREYEEQLVEGPLERWRLHREAEQEAKRRAAAQNRGDVDPSA